MSNFAMETWCPESPVTSAKKAKAKREKYESFLETLVAWGVEDESDETTQTVIGNVYKTEQ